MGLTVRIQRVILQISASAVPVGGGGGTTDHAALSSLAWTGAGHTGSNLGLAGWDGAGAAAVVASSSFGRGLLAVEDAAAGRSALSAQAASADLSAIAALSGTGLLARTGVGTAGLVAYSTTPLGDAIPRAGPGGSLSADWIPSAGIGLPGVVPLAEDGSVSGGQVVQGSDSRLAKGALFPIMMATAGVALTNMPAADTEVTASDVHRVLAFLSGYTTARYLLRRGTGVATAGATIRIQYTTDLSGASGWTNLGLSYDITTASARQTSATVAIPTGAKGAPVLLRAVGAGGNGVDDPTVTQIAVLVY